MRVFVTGASGWIGSAVVPSCSARATRSSARPFDASGCSATNDTSELGALHPVVATPLPFLAMDCGLQRSGRCGVVGRAEAPWTWSLTTPTFCMNAYTLVGR